MSFGLGAGRKVTIVGAGFSGLVSAYALVRAGFRVHVIEASAEAGGLIQTLDLEEGLVETAANALLNSAAVEELFAATGVEMVGTRREAKKRYIFRNGKARRWPLSLSGTFGVLKFLLRYLFARQTVAPRAQESARAWAERVMGVEASRYLVEAALQGIYAGDPSRMSASLIFSRMFAKKRQAVFQSAGMSFTEHNSPNRVKAKNIKRKGSVSPAHGMGELMRGLVTYLKSKGVTFDFNQPVLLATEPPHPHVVATSAIAASRVLGSLTPEKARVLERVEYSPVVTSTVFFDGTDSKSKGFGVLFPPLEKRRALGVLKNNFIFRNRVKRGYSETWIQGGALTPEGLVDLSDHDLLKRIELERQDSFGRQDQILASRTTRWKLGIPHYTLELERDLEKLQGFEKNVILMGNYLGEIGLAKILDRALRLPLQISSYGHWQPGFTKT